VEGTHTVVSGASDGSVHVWRVEMAKAGGTAMHTNDPKSQIRYRSVGASNVRTMDKHEGEVLSVSHFNSSSASVITYATQVGMIHSWDLRCECEPFKLQYSPELGYLTSMALGSDRNWIVSGTSNGYVALWDIRFQQCVKLWQHKHNVPINRLATSTVSLPENWGMNSSSTNVRPFIFVAAGANECSMFDVFSSSCTQCFRTVAEDSRNLNSHTEDPPELIDTSFKMIRGSGLVKAAVIMNNAVPTFPLSTINCMVGNIGTSANSYLITGGSDCTIRYWDFTAPSKCFVVNGMNNINSKPTYERIDFDGQRRLMLCRQSQHQLFRDNNKHPRRQFHGLRKPEQNHTDAILDIKVVANNEIISCSRDCTIKVWR
jgi:phosphoinositide-3-kinase, regulatory subunit 4